MSEQSPGLGASVVRVLTDRWPWVIAVILAAVVGAWIGRLFPPFIIDSGFLREFLTSAGFGGCMAVAAAVVAYAGVTLSSRRLARSAAETVEQKTVSDSREHYWTRFTYAAERALSRDDGESKFGILLLLDLADQNWMNIEDNKVALAVSEVIIGIRRPDEATFGREGDAL